MKNNFLVQTIETSSKFIRDIAVSPDGKFVISSSLNNIDIWDAASGNLIRTLEGHECEVRTVAVSPNGRYIVSWSMDRNITI